jgi:hypothetical protein
MASNQSVPGYPQKNLAYGGGNSTTLIVKTLPASTISVPSNSFRPAAIPSSMFITASQPVLIIGSGFLTASSVTFGGVPVLSFQIVSDSQLIATPAPSFTPGTVQIVITNASGTVSLPFTFLANPPVPLSASPNAFLLLSSNPNAFLLNSGPYVGPNSLVAAASGFNTLLTWAQPLGTPAYLNNIYRSQASGVFGAPLATIKPGASYLDTTAPTGTNYYLVSVVNAGGEFFSNQTSSFSFTPQASTIFLANTSQSAIYQNPTGLVPPVNAGDPVGFLQDVSASANNATNTSTNRLAFEPATFGSLPGIQATYPASLAFGSSINFIAAAPFTVWCVLKYPATNQQAIVLGSSNDLTYLGLLGNQTADFSSGAGGGASRSTTYTGSTGTIAVRFSKGTDQICRFAASGMSEVVCAGGAINFPFNFTCLANGPGFINGNVLPFGFWAIDNTDATRSNPTYGTAMQSLITSLFPGVTIP